MTVNQNLNISCYNSTELCENAFRVCIRGSVQNSKAERGLGPPVLATKLSETRVTQ